MGVWAALGGREKVKEKSTGCHCNKESRPSYNKNSFIAWCGGLLFVSDPAEVRILKIVGVLKAVTEDPVKRAMSKKQDSCEHHNVSAGVHTQQVDHDSNSFVMKDIVGIRPNARPEKISQHAYVWREKQCRVGPPGKR